MDNQAFNTRRLVITAMLIAVSIVLSVPIGVGPLTSLGFITLVPGVIAFTFLHVPAIVGAILEGPVVGAIVGLAFGLFSLFLAGQQPAGSQNAIFVDPVISVLPRLFIGPVAWVVYSVLKKLGDEGLVGAAIAGTLTNTLLVIGAISLRLHAPFVATLASVSLNVVIELVVASVIVVAVISALRGYTGGRAGSTV